MKRYRFPEGICGKAALGVFFILQLFLARDTLMATSILGFTKSQILMIALTGCLAVYFLFLNRDRLKDIFTDSRMLLAAICAAAVLIPAILKRDWQLMYFSMLFCILFAVLLSYILTCQQAAKYYVVILAVLAAYSVLATYGLRNLAEGANWSIPMFHNSIGVEFYNFGITYVSQSYVKNRNFGIFREPGVYQFFLLLALFLNNYYVDWKSEKKLWLVNGILSVTMLTTLATGGWVELFLLAVFLFFDKKLYRHKITWVVLGTVFAAAAVLAYLLLTKNRLTINLYWEIYGMTVSKFQPGEESAADRLNSFLSNAQFFLANPLAGSPLAEVLHAVENNTSSSLILYAVLGIVGGSLNVLGWIILAWKRERCVLGNLILPVILAMSFNTQNLTADVFFWLFPIMALAWWQPLQKKKGVPDGDIDNHAAGDPA